MLVKYYTADTYQESEDNKTIIRIGSRIVGVWFWQSPIVAYRKLTFTGHIIVNVRRIK